MSQSVRPFRPGGPIRSRLYGLLCRGGNLLHRAGSACEYLAAGTLRTRDLGAAMGRQYRDYGIDADHVDEGFDLFETRVYTQWLPPPKRVLLVGCGTGRDLIALARLGHQVTGVERSRELADVARAHLVRHGLTAPVAHESIETVDLDGSYDAAIFSPSCYSNIQSSAARIAALARLASHMPPAGCLVIHYIASPSHSRAACALARTAALLTAADWRPEPGDAFTRYHGSRGALLFNHTFRPGEAAQEAAAAGFDVVHEYLNEDRSNCIILTRA